MKGASRWLEARVASGTAAAVHANRKTVWRFMVVIPSSQVVRDMRG
jgi:hypothetical protein